MARGAQEVGLRSQAFEALALAPPLEVGVHFQLPCGGEALRVATPGGPLLVVISTSHPLQLAFEATLFDLLAEERYPAPRPRRAATGALIAPLEGPAGPAAAACYGWPPGEALDPQRATIPQLLELGRLLARLHRLGEAHPASVPDGADGPSLATRLPRSAEADRLLPALRVPPSGLPTGAAHGRLAPQTALFLGDRCSGIIPAGSAASAPLLLDVAEAIVGWALPRPDAVPALRGLLAGYQALRRLDRDERASLWASVRHAAAREGARRLLAGAAFPLEPLEAAERLGPDAFRDAV